MNDTVAELSTNPGFQTFKCDASQYLMGIHDRAARVFGVRYVQYLETLRSAAPQTARRPRTDTPAQFW